MFLEMVAAMVDESLAKHVRERWSCNSGRTKFRSESGLVVHVRVAGCDALELLATRYNRKEDRSSQVIITGRELDAILKPLRALIETKLAALLTEDIRSE
jgi:hypothetical protein